MDRRPSLLACANANGGLASIPAARNRMYASSFLCHHSGETECVSKKWVPLPLRHLSSRQARTGQPDHLPRLRSARFRQPKNRRQRLPRPSWAGQQDVRT